MSNATNNAPKTIAKVTLLLGDDAIAKATADIASRGKKLDTLIHRTGVSVMYHAMAHGDVRPATSYIEALPKSSRGKACIKWLVDHMPIELGEDGAPVTNDNGHWVLKKGRTDEDFRIEDAAKVPFWAYTKEKDPTPIGVEQLLKYLQRLANGGSKAAPVSESAQLAALAALEGIERASNDDASMGVVVELAKADVAA